MLFSLQLDKVLGVDTHPPSEMKQCRNLSVPGSPSVMVGREGPVGANPWLMYWSRA